jgi:hypothetical protein
MQTKTPLPIISSYLMFYRISIQISVHDVFAIKFTSFTCYDTVSYYDTTPISHVINWCVTSDFCQHGMHDTTYDTHIGASLNR